MSLSQNGIRNRVVRGRNPLHPPAVRVPAGATRQTLWRAGSSFHFKPPRKTSAQAHSQGQRAHALPWRGGPAFRSSDSAH
jgi:hypothetical protein